MHEVEILVADRAGDMAKVAAVYRFPVAPGEMRTETVPLPAAGAGVRVGVRSRVGNARSPAAGPVTLKVYEPPTAPASVTATNDPAGVLITWPTVPPTPAPTAAPTPSPTAATPLSPSAVLATTPAPAAAPGPPPTSGYQIRRRPPTGPAVLLFEKAIAGPPFLDETAKGPGRFCYTVRSVIMIDPPVASADSPEACVEVKDVRPPQPPTGLTAAVRAGAIELSWSPSTDGDVASYRVYRGSGGVLPAKVAELPATERAYKDATGARGAAYRFTVTAVDASGNESSPSPPAEATLP